MPAQTTKGVPHVSHLRHGFSMLGIAIGLTGCGYHTAGAAAHVPANVRTMAIPVFKTNVQQFHTEVALTDATIREMNTRTRYRVIHSDDTDASDAMLTGTVLTENIAPLTYDPSTGSTSSYLVQITAKIVLTARDGRVLYRNDRLSFREQYQSTQDLSAFIQEDGAAVQRLSKDLASEIVADVLNSF
ncbi:Lipopolysaccharide-assembly [Terriglobus roseus]|uniref:Lipopolysaccharide-assembly n=2 Tax=Terriglobus roseus TaxID=392734 RepID=A0A1H4L3M0_9BACT|nr:Lipopolysaccharide-assembly [Terriglobus roseus]